MIAVLLISTIGQSQAIAGDETQPQEQGVLSDGMAPIPEMSPDTIETEAILVDEIPEVAAGMRRVVISGWNLQPWNRSINNLLIPNSNGCLGYVRSESGVRYATTYFPFSLPIGSKITNIYWTGVDWISSTADAQMNFWLEREHWKGQARDYIVHHSSGSMASSDTPFNYYKAVDHIVTTNYSYQIRVDLLNTSELKFMHVCQITIDYIEPSPFYMALPITVRN